MLEGVVLMAEMIQNFLDSGLLDIDDENVFNHLVETAGELATLLAENPDKIIPHALIAIDPNAPIDDPVFDEVENLLKSRWKFLRKRHPDRPRQFLRSIIFQGLELASQEDEAIVGLIWLTTRSFIPYAKLYGDIDVYRNFIEEMGKAFESKVSSSITFDPTSPEKKKGAKQFNRDNLEIELASIISNRYNNDAIPPERNPNPVYNLPNFPADNWINEFIPRAKTLLLKVLDTIQEDTSSSLNQVTKMMRSFVSHAEGQRIKTDILWWKQALYSPRLTNSYRDLAPHLACIVMALDLADIVSPPYPISVDFILTETVRNLLAESDKKSISPFSFREVFQALTTSDLRPKLQELLEAINRPTSRTSLLHFLSAYVHGDIQNIEEITSIVGVSLDDKITLPDFGAWLFRDLQAEKLLQK